MTAGSSVERSRALTSTRKRRTNDCAARNGANSLAEAKCLDSKETSHLPRDKHFGRREG